LFLFLLASIQLKFRTLAGWIMLLAASVWYAVKVAINPGSAFGHYGEYAFFIACGLVPAAFLLLFRPRLNPGQP
jgi:hypothetical protein